MLAGDASAIREENTHGKWPHPLLHKTTEGPGDGVIITTVNKHGMYSPSLKIAQRSM